MGKHLSDGECVVPDQKIVAAPDCDDSAFARLTSESDPKEWTTNMASPFTVFFIKFQLFVNQIDPFAVFKPHEAQSEANSRIKNEIYDSAQCRATDEPWVKWMHKYRAFYSRYLRFYYLIKTFFICLLQFTIYLLENGHKSAQAGRQGWVLPLLVGARDLIGNPLSTHTDYALLLFGALSVVIMIILAMVPSIHERNPFDLPSLRFLLDPKRELCRIDLTVKEKLDELITSIENHKLKRQEEYRSVWKNKDERQVNLEFTKWRAIVDNIEQNKKYLDRFHAHLNSLRPKSFSFASFRQTQRVVLVSKVISYVASIIWFMLTLYMALIGEVNTRCQLAGHFNDDRWSLLWPVEPCDQDPLALFSFSEKIFIFELILNNMIVAVAFEFFVWTLIWLAIGQFKLISSLRGALQECLTQLRAIIGRHNDATSEEQQDSSDCKLNDNFFENMPACKCRALSLTGGYYTSIEAYKIRLEQELGIELKQQSIIDELLLRIFVEVSVVNDELRRGSTCISRLFRLFFLANLGLAVACILNGGLINTTHETVNMHLFVFLVEWANVNMICILCASIAAETLNAERIIWSIAATNGMQSKGTLATNHLSSIIWHKMALLSCGISQSYCVQFIGVTISYKHVMTVNFVIISIVSMILLHLSNSYH